MKIAAVILLVVLCAFSWRRYVLNNMQRDGLWTTVWGLTALSLSAGLVAMLL